MAIVIPTIVDTQIDRMKASLRPVLDSTTMTYSCPTPPYAVAYHAADLLRVLTNLIDSVGLACTGEPYRH